MSRPTRQVPADRVRRTKGGLCEWYALCDRPAAHQVRHPILGTVPTCQRCVDKLELADRIVGTVQR